MGFYADLHLHSKFSRATSRDCDPEHLAYWARKKGISIVGTGDFTHPGWLAEIEEKLIPAEPGLFRLQPDLERSVDSWLDNSTGEPTRFVLQVEISTIYKKDGRTRKVHHLIYVPDLEKAKNLIRSLQRIGNLNSDGRPILGLDSRDLLEITLEAGEGCYLIPAHIWTPWFAVLGSKSGFDSIEECYGDLSSQIFALETGLSSDPAMNRRLSSLDRFALVSNSDAHSPSKIGREACVFYTEMDFFSLRRALETGEDYGGTVEFFAEEGKYHFDGHRKCGVCLSPEDSRKSDDLCPACGKPMTLGVMHRVCDLADRDCASTERETAPYRSLIPLEEVLAELRGVGPGSKAVQKIYEKMISRIGTELFILESADLEEVERVSSSLVAEALFRMREGRVIRQPGFDGQYGRIRLFTDGELNLRTGGVHLFDLFEDFLPDECSRQLPEPQIKKSPSCPTRTKSMRKPSKKLPATKIPAPGDLLSTLDPEQRSAVEIAGGPLLILAGPGTGKTHTLTSRLAHLIRHRGVPPGECLAITFTRRAAREMAERLKRLLPDQANPVPVMTLHALGFSILRENGSRLGLSDPFRIAGERECRELLKNSLSVSDRKANHLLARISRLRREDEGVGSETGESDIAVALESYEKELRRKGVVDFDDLIALPVRLLESNPDIAEVYRSRHRWISVDEYQDIDRMQYRLIKLLVRADGNLCVIGDPDQSIYGFRGADVRCLQEFQRDFPSARIIHLTRNYRSTRAIVDGSLQMMAPESLLNDRRLLAQAESLHRIEIHQCATDRAEAEFIVHTIERMIGGSTFFSMDSARVESHEGESLSFGDFAVLYRTDAQAGCLIEALHRSGIPFQKRSHDHLMEVPSVQAILQEMEEIRKGSSEHLSISELIQQAAETVRGNDPLLDLYLPALHSVAKDFPRDNNGFLSELTLGVDVDLWDARAEAVSLLTLHAAKGLEFPVVFITACEDGILPLRWGGNEENTAEERRLFFVGMTRARKRLILIHAKRRSWRGSVKSLDPSPFLLSIAEELKDRHLHEMWGKPKSEYRQMILFEEFSL